MLLTTTDTIPGRDYEVLGLVIGNFVNSKNMFSDLGQSLKAVVGGELKAYTQMMASARHEATMRMTASAEQLGADGVRDGGEICLNKKAACAAFIRYSHVFYPPARSARTALPPPPFLPA